MSPVRLLFQHTIESQNIHCFSWKDEVAFFETEDDLGFDIFAASFYLITRYEEYLPHKLDEYGRFGHINSVAYKQNFLKQPIVNLWIQHFKNLLLSKFPGLKFNQSPFKFIPTFDVDIAYNYLHKGVLRNIGGTIKSIIRLDSASLKERLNVLARNKPDPYNIFDWLNHVHKVNHLHPIYFFLLAEKVKGYDKNINVKNHSFQQLIQSITKVNEVGIHPSWQSGDDSLLVNKEIATLKSIVCNEVDKSRQHYIRMTLPETYQCSLKQVLRRFFYGLWKYQWLSGILLFAPPMVRP